MWRLPETKAEALAELIGQCIISITITVREKMRARIIGTGSCLPATIVTNDDLSKIMDTSDEWISSRTGIRERHLVKDETTAGMSAKAAKRAMEDAGVSAAEIDLIIVGTLSADNVTPSCACEVQAQIGAVNAVAFDINAACAGFMFALNVANAYLQMGTYKTALILGAETLSKIMDGTTEVPASCSAMAPGRQSCARKRERRDYLPLTRDPTG